MRAARYYGKQDLRVEDVVTPEVREDDDVLLQVAYCGICGTDLHEYAVGPIVTPTSPHPLTGATLPQTMGHEFSARVAAVGAGVRDVVVGDRVAVMPAIICGRCRYCRRGQGHLCVQFACTGLSAETGGLAEYALVKEYQVAKLPDEVSDLEGAVIEPAAVAAYGVDRAGVTGGDIVLVTGAGPIGILSAMYASAVGASAVVISEPNPNRSRLAASLDIGHVVDPTTGELDELVGRLTGGDGVDLAIECSGSTPGLASCVTQTRRRASIVQTGLHTKPATLDAMALSEKDLTLYGSWCWWMTDWPRIIRMVASGQYPVGKAVTSQIPLDDVVTQGFDTLIDPQGDQLKVLVRSGS
ncbi:MAG TPA: alcohol dehydrogenase catalytic domain-containing protein [Intrasporangium sp.]|uniref:alcohol dehydrogenase catalytic domain-containing protein n=1 Tax=Intrasporangium sp. TaxID=1925024 RepID=UPI002D79069D|nr:alcohol dehydrogenase catalytic domain-containing protein [Intrasporangium sp.]HET7399081.1 alcohol dehydrogenase catalytic domain-containing protein [Intrasporangium sp.]